MNPHRIPGRIIGNRLSKRVSRQRHYLRWVGGYAWSVEQIQRAKAQGVQELEIIEDTGRVLRIGLNSVLENGKRFQFGSFEPQVGISESSMTILDKNQPELFGGVNEY